MKRYEYIIKSIDPDTKDGEKSYSATIHADTDKKALEEAQRVFQKLHPDYPVRSVILFADGKEIKP